MKKASRRQGNAPTIFDVAQAAGVSPMTVSRVMNAENKVRPSTQAKVHAAIAALDYAPNPAAQALAGVSQIRIAILYSNPSAAYLSEFLLGGLDQASRGNAQLIVEKCEPDDHEGDVARRLAAGGIDGLILPPPLCDSVSILNALAETQTPAVAVATGRDGGEVSIVSIDDHAAAYAMTSHLAALGHRKIGMILGHSNQTVSARRYAGYAEAMKSAGLPVVDGLVARGLFTYQSGLDAAEQLLDQADAPTAIFASNDDMAAATVAVAHRRGLDVPGDLTVCGFDDTALATAIWPELTTIRQPIAEMSRAAIGLLLDIVRRKRAGEGIVAPRRLMLDFTLVRRQSDAAPRTGGIAGESQRPIVRER